MFWDVKEDKDNINITTLCTHTKFRGVGAEIVNFFSGFKKGYQLHRLLNTSIRYQYLIEF